MPYLNKSDQRDYARKHYLRNKAQYKARAKAHTARQRVRLRQFVMEYLKTHPCVDCGETEPVVLQFDHVRGTKRSEVSTLMLEPVSIDTLRAEIAKCDVRCANCHYRQTAKKGSWWKTKDQFRGQLAQRRNP